MTIATSIQPVERHHVTPQTARQALRILVVEDDPEMRRWVTELLEEEGFRMQVAPDALSGIISLLADGADLVVTDWKMPGYDGLRLLESTRALAPGTPVVLVTAYAEPGFRESVCRRGACSVLEKPFRRDELMRHVTHALRQAGHGQA